jgi:hypothetical protein
MLTFNVTVWCSGDADGAASTLRTCVSNSSMNESHCCLIRTATASESNPASLVASAR